MLDDFMVRAALAGLGVAIAAATAWVFCGLAPHGLFWRCDGACRHSGGCNFPNLVDVSFCRRAFRGVVDGADDLDPQAGVAMRWTRCLG